MGSKKHKKIVIPLLFSAFSFHFPSFTATTSQMIFDIENPEEAFFIRKISEFIKDQDYSLAKKQILHFFEAHPKSVANDQLHLILGDLYLQEKDYEKALQAYSHINGGDYKLKSLINKLQCLYELDRYAEMINESSAYFPKIPTELQARKEEFAFLIGEGYLRSVLAQPDFQFTKEYLKKARWIFEKLQHSSYNDPSMFALAEIYKQQGEFEKSKQVFLELAKRHPNRKNEMVFHAALCASKVNPKEALSLFDQIDMHGKDEASIRYNQMVLHFENKNYPQVLEMYENLQPSVPEHHKFDALYIYGKSLFETNNFEQCCNIFQKFLHESPNHLDTKRKNALLTLLIVYEKLLQEEKFQEVYEQFIQFYPNDHQTMKVRFLKAMLAKNLGKKEEAVGELVSMLSNYDNFKDQEETALELISLHFASGDFTKSHELAAKMISDVPDSQYKPFYHKYLISSSIELYNKQKGQLTRSILFREVQATLKEPQLLSKEETKECFAILGKLGYEMHSYKIANKAFDEFLAMNEPSLQEGYVHLLKACSLLKLLQYSKDVQSHIKKAFTIEKSFAENPTIHLEIFNSCTHFLKKSNDASMNTLVEKLAAKHLDKVMHMSPALVDFQNQMWLANHHFTKLTSLQPVYEWPKKTQNFDHNRATKALCVYERLLHDHEKDLDHQTAPYYEWEMFKYASLLGKIGHFDEKMKVLSYLSSLQETREDLQFELSNETLMELAKGYEMRGEISLALQNYTLIDIRNPKKNHYLGEFARFHRHRLQSLHSIANIEEMLSHYKELQISRHPKSEPLHLEAYIEYAKERAKHSETDGTLETYMFFLQRIGEDFADLEDPVNVRYHEALLSNAKAQKMYDEYTNFIHFEKERLNMLMNHDENPQHSKALEEKYKELYENTDSFYLMISIERTLDLLKERKIL